jgi:LuxR family maltose regulon positive regulatory protein
METHALLQTKLHVPLLRSSLVPRPRLIDKLNAGMDGRLILVSARADR